MRAVTAKFGLRVSQRGLLQEPAVSVSNRMLQWFSSKIGKKPYLPWVDKKLPPEVRVNKFSEVELGQLGWRAVSLDSVELADRCCRFQSFVGMRLAHCVLDRALAEKHYFDNSPEQQPFKVPLLLFQKILFGWACLTTKGAIAQGKMRELVDIIIQITREEEERFNVDSDDNIDDYLRLQPNTSLYNTYLIGLRNAAEVSPKAAITGIGVLDEMVNMHEQHGWHTKPNTKSYTFVIKAFANSKFKNAGKEAEKVLRRMQRAHEEEKENYFSETGTPYNAADPVANQRKIVTADEIAYSYAIQAYAQEPSLEAAGKARDLLIEVINIKDGTAKANFALFTGVIAAYANLAQNVRVSKEIRRTAAQQSEEILNILLDDIQSLNENNLLRNKGQVSFVAPFNACMNAFARCDAPDAALKAESILQRLLADFTEGRSSIYPDTISFNTVLHGWSRSARVTPEAPKKAEELMTLQTQLVDSNVLPQSAKPDIQSYAVVMTAYARSNDADKVSQTYRILHELIEAIFKGRVVADSSLVVAFTAVLDAAAYPANIKPSEPAETPTFGLESDTSCSDDYTIALQAYRELKDDVYQLGCQPDHLAYAKMVNVIGTHTDPRSAERRQMLQLVFEDACGAGEVSKIVLKYLFKVCPDKDLLISLLQSEKLASRYVETVDELPRLWTRNVPGRFRHRRVVARKRSFKR